MMLGVRWLVFHLAFFSFFLHKKHGLSWICLWHQWKATSMAVWWVIIIIQRPRMGSEDNFAYSDDGIFLFRASGIGPGGLDRRFSFKTFHDSGLLFLDNSDFLLPETKPDVFLKLFLLLSSTWSLHDIESKATLLLSISWLIKFGFVRLWLFLVVHSIKAVIAARQNSNDASSFVLGFKQVLRGVCDGELLLHQDSCTICRWCMLFGTLIEIS